jgi:hypothetical protein
MKTLELTGRDLVRALAPAIVARPAVDAAVRARAEEAAARIAEAGVAVRVVRRGHADYAVEASGPGLFARELGSLDAPAGPVVAAAEEGKAEVR